MNTIVKVALGIGCLILNFRSKMVTLRRPQVLVGVTAVLLAVTSFLVLRPREVDLIESAKVELSCLMEGDAGCVLEHMNSIEREKGGWTKESVAYALKEIIEPFWRRQVKSGRIETDRLTYQGFAYQPYMLPKGIPLNRQVTNYSNGTSAFFLLSDQLTAVFQGMALEKYGALPPATFMRVGLIEGIERFAAPLEARGVKGLAIAEPMRGEIQFVTFRQALANVRDKVERDKTPFPASEKEGPGIPSR